MKKIIFALLVLTFAAMAAPLEYRVALTRQDPAMDWWYAVPQGFGFTPRLMPIEQVTTGEKFRVVPFFTSYNTDSNCIAKLTFDLEIVSETGKVVESIKGCTAHNGKATQPNLLLSAAIANISFDDGLPYGDYSIHFTAYDHVAQITNRQTKIVKHIPFATRELTKEEREKVFFEYPIAPDPTKAYSAFLQTEQSFFNEENEPIWSAIWFYKTIFEKNEFMVPHLLKDFPNATYKQQKDILMLACMLGKGDELPRLSTKLRALKRIMDAGRYPDPYDLIDDLKQVDMLWAEFYATGELKPIRQLVTSLEWVKYVGTLDRIKAGELDPNQLEVYREGMLEAVFQSVLHSLRTNCSKTPLAFQYCVGIFSRNELDEAAHQTLGLLLQSFTDEKKKESQE